MNLTPQKLYAVLRKAGYSGKNSSSRWPVVSRDSDTYRIWYTITWETYEGAYAIPVDQRCERLQDMQGVLSRAGITSRFADDPPQLIVEEAQ